MTFLVLALVLDYADRMLLGALGPTLERDFHLGTTQLGLLSSAFGIVGAGAALPLGVLTDRVARTRLLALSLALWAGAEALVGGAASFALLVGLRLLLGVVAATTGPTVPSLTGDLVPARQRGRALGFIDGGQLLGGGVGVVLAAVVTAFLSWRWCFWLLAATSAGLAVGFFRAHEPARTAAGPTVGQGDAAEAEHRQSVVHLLARERAITPSRGALLHAPPTGMSLWDTAVYVVRVRTNVIVLLARATGDYFLAGVGTFGVVFATAQYHLSQGAADVALLALGSGALGGVLLAGRLSDALLRRGRINGRVWVAILGHLLAPVPLLPAFLTHSRWVALPLFSMGAFFLAGTQPALDAIRVDVIVPGLRGRAEAIRQVLRTAVEGGAPLVVGLLAGVLAGAAGLRLAFLATLPLLVVNGLLLLLALRTYPHDVSAALASAERFRQRGAPEAGAGRTP